jgi:hypothetical protein
VTSIRHVRQSLHICSILFIFKESRERGVNWSKHVCQNWNWSKLFQQIAICCNCFFQFIRFCKLIIQLVAVLGSPKFWWVSILRLSLLDEKWASQITAHQNWKLLSIETSNQHKSAKKKIGFPFFYHRDLNNWAKII